MNQSNGLGYNDASNFMTGGSGLGQQNGFGQEVDVHASPGGQGHDRQFNGSTSLLNSDNFMNDRKPQLKNIH